MKNIKEYIEYRKGQRSRKKNRDEKEGTRKVDDVYLRYVYTRGTVAERKKRKKRKMLWHTCFLMAYTGELLLYGLHDKKDTVVAIVIYTYDSENPFR